MAALIEKNDTMFSVREKPWHGLGTVIADYPTIDDAIIYSGLNWKASIQPMQVSMNDNGSNIMVPVNGHYAIVREGKENIVLGVVGGRYEIYQNEEMWRFIDTFQKQSGIKLETAGSLKNGRTTWVLAKNGAIETISGDPIDEYFLFRNSFDGTTPISCLFTNIRVVCNNTLTAALKGTRNIFNVRHTASATDQIKEVQKALGYRLKYQGAMKDALTTLSKFKMGAVKTDEFLSKVVFPEPQTILADTNRLDPQFKLDDASKISMTIRANKISAVLNLVESGAGTDIPGVKGTAYGLWNALTEWADHEKQIRVVGERNPDEVRFENAFYGTGATFKNNCFHELMKIAA